MCLVVYARFMCGCVEHLRTERCDDAENADVAYCDKPEFDMIENDDVTCGDEECE